jgi:hypothetical protein
MARARRRLGQERKLRDLVGDPVVISAGIATYPPEIQRARTCSRTRAGLLRARQDGGGVVVSTLSGGKMG